MDDRLCDAFGNEWVGSIKCKFRIEVREEMSFIIQISRRRFEQELKLSKAIRAEVVLNATISLLLFARWGITMNTYLRQKERQHVFFVRMIAT